MAATTVASTALRSSNGMYEANGFPAKFRFRDTKTGTCDLGIFDSGTTFVARAVSLSRTKATSLAIRVYDPSSTITRPLTYSPTDEGESSPGFIHFSLSTVPTLSIKLAGTRSIGVVAPFSEL